MSGGTLTAVVLVYGYALWLGLYLIVRDPRSPALLLTGLGLAAYALALACDLLAGATPASDGPERAREPLLLLPALLWTGALIHLLPEEVSHRDRLARLWSIAGTLVAVLILLVSFGPGWIKSSVPPGGLVPFVFGGVVLAPMLALVCFVWWSLRGRRVREVAGVLAVVTLFLTLSTALVLSPLDWIPRFSVLLALGLDLILLGLAIAYFDAFGQGEALLPDMVRSFDAAFLAALVFGGQVALTIVVATGPILPMLVLLLATVATAVAVPTFSDALSAALDRLALLPSVRRTRSELRQAASALPRTNPELDPTTLDETEFARLTRRALSNFGDLPRLCASPLINLTLITDRLAARGVPDDTLGRAAELKSVLAESIARLKPPVDEDFGTSDEWRHYNALHFPYVVGLKPYSSRDKTKPKDPTVREALEWFDARVPERTLRNWQNAAAKLVARDLLARNGSFPE